MGISEKQLLQDPCISVIVGASILFRYDENLRL